MAALAWLIRKIRLMRIKRDTTEEAEKEKEENWAIDGSEEWS
jgi:hypothetical protein